MHMYFFYKLASETVYKRDVLRNNILPYGSYQAVDAMLHC